MNLTIWRCRLDWLKTSPKLTPFECHRLILSAHYLMILDQVLSYVRFLQNGCEPCEIGFYFKSVGNISSLVKNRTYTAALNLPNSPWVSWPWDRPTVTALHQFWEPAQSGIRAHASKCSWLENTRINQLSYLGEEVRSVWLALSPTFLRCFQKPCSSKLGQVAFISISKEIISLFQF